MNDYIVYVKTDSENKIISINSSVFLADITDWTQIDEGIGDKYHHAQGNYLEKGLINEYGVYNYKLIDGAVTERTEEEKQAEIPLPSLQSFTITTDKPQITADGADTAIITISLNPTGTGIEMIDILVDGVPIHELTPVVNDVATFEFSATDAGKYIIEAISGKVRDYILIKAV